MVEPYQPILQQLEPKRTYASFLNDFVDPIHPDPALDSTRTFVPKWLDSVGSEREKSCQSNTHLHRSNGSTILRQLMRSAP